LGRHGRPLSQGDDQGEGRKGSFSPTRQRVTTNLVKSPQELPSWTTLARAFGPFSGGRPNDGRCGGSPSLPPADISKHAGPGWTNVGRGLLGHPSDVSVSPSGLEPTHTKLPRAAAPKSLAGPPDCRGPPERTGGRDLGTFARALTTLPASPPKLSCTDRPAGSPLH
jgi:hypothetical protein